MTPRELFGQTVRLSLEDLQLRDEGTGEYLTGLLTRFVTTSEWLGRGSENQRLDGTADVLAEIQRVWQADEPHFDPARELTLRRHLGDSALFLTGFFWERARHTSTKRHHTRLGKWAYRFLADYERARGSRLASVYADLAEHFESYAGALMYLREVYLDANLAPWPHPLIARITMPD